MFKAAGLRFRKADILYFLYGVLLPVGLLLPVYMLVRKDMGLESENFFSLLAGGQQKLFYYLTVGLLEEFIFRGLILGLLLKKVKSVGVKITVSALVFTFPHIFNTDNIPLPVMILFPFLYGIAAGEMFVFTQSIWMPAGFHWIWNYIIAGVFLKTGTQHLVYIWIMMEMLLLIPSFYYIFKKQNRSFAV